MQKASIRSLYKQKRLEITPDELERRSAEICEQLFTHFQLEGKVLSLFLPIERQREINTYIILEKGISIGATIALPKSDFEKHTMKHFQFERHGQLIVNEFGIPEPSHGKTIKADALDIVFVPLLAVDASGHRIGYGKGFYDRFLRKCRPNCIFIGLHLFDEMCVIDDIDRHDIRLDYCITPTQIIRFDERK
jgi:5-formyltetrahydrofolate cyclo-ligase